MSPKLLTFALLASLALVSVPLPSVTSAPNECQPTGANTPNGDPAAPPCLATDALRPTVDAYATICPAAPAAAPDAVKRAACKPFYILLHPDYDGNPGNGAQLDFTVIWQENNNCPGLQRVGGAGCVGPDKRIMMPS